MRNMSYVSKTIDIGKPHLLANKVKSKFSTLGINNVTIIDGSAEIFIVIKNKKTFWNKTPQNYNNLKNENRKSVLFPKILSLLDTNKHSKILDYGGGDGSFLEMIKFKAEKYLYDPSEGMIEVAKNNVKTINHFSLDDLVYQKEKFDLVTLIHVVTIIKEDTELNRIFAHIHSILKNKGELIIALTHPAFKNNIFSTFHTDFHNEKFNYFEEKIYKTHLNTVTQNKYVSFECYHRPVSKLLNMIITNNFQISYLDEVQDTDFNNLSKEFNFPPFLIIKCSKI